MERGESHSRGKTSRWSNERERPARRERHVSLISGKDSNNFISFNWEDYHHVRQETDGRPNSIIGSTTSKNWIRFNVRIMLSRSNNKFYSLLPIN